MEKAWSLALWSVLVCRIAIITDKVNKKTPYCVGCSKKYQRRTTKKVVCVETGIVYESIKEANKAMGCKKSGVGGAIKDGYRVKGYHWKYFTD